MVSVRGDDGRVVCARCVVADSALTRMRGLLGRRNLESDEGILLRPASSVHTCFMRFPIDAVFLGEDLVISKIVRGLRTWRAAGSRGARAVLELPAGGSDERGLRVGERLRIDA
jgi:uncharacterized membrane protein (UPF0127 family)